MAQTPLAMPSWSIHGQPIPFNKPSSHAPTAPSMVNQPLSWNRSSHAPRSEAAPHLFPVPALRILFQGIQLLGVFLLQFVQSCPLLRLQSLSLAGNGRVHLWEGRKQSVAWARPCSSRRSTGTEIKHWCCCFFLFPFFLLLFSPPAAELTAVWRTGCAPLVRVGVGGGWVARRDVSGSG